MSTDDTTFLNAVALHMLVQAYFDPAPVPIFSQASLAACAWLKRNQLIVTEPDSEQGARSLEVRLHLTERGQVFVKHLLTVPLPVATWAVPKRQED